ncbi:MAG: cell division protein SepF [Lachnospiraceae bacterium]|nr:cell division protein SepF [Lachnospiraceae bacterium]
MAGFFDKLKKTFNFDDDDEAFDDFEEEEIKKAEEAKKEQLRANSIPNPRNNNYDVSGYSQDGGYTPKNNTRSNNYASAFINRDTNEKSLKIDRPYGSKFIPISTTRRGNEVCIMKPINFNDSQDICDVLLSSRIAVVNLEDLELPMAQRIIDFLSGSVYALDGKLFNISNFIYIIAPASVDISGDYAEIAEQTGFDVPVLNP